MVVKTTRALAMRRSQQKALMRAVLLALVGSILAPQQYRFATSSKVGPQLLQQVKGTGPLNVYVYDDPAFDHTALIQCYRNHYSGVAPWQDDDMAQDMGEIWLYQSLLSTHGASRTQRMGTFSSSHCTPCLVSSS